MNKISIVASSQGDSLARLNNVSWAKLLLLNDGKFIENDNQITFETSEGMEFYVDKKECIVDVDKVTYSSSLELIDGPQVIVEELIEAPGVYHLRGYYEGSFIVTMMIDNKTDNQLQWFRQRFNPNQLGLLANALLKNLFPSPQSGSVLVERHDDYSCTLYFDQAYYRELLGSVNGAYESGKFASSNAEDAWLDFRLTLRQSFPSKTVDKGSLIEYFIKK